MFLISYNYILLILGQSWLFIPKNEKDCSTLGAKDISTIEECQAVARFTKNLFSHVWNMVEMPKRCHMTFPNQNIYWNSHKIGGTLERAAPICKFGW